MFEYEQPYVPVRDRAQESATLLSRVCFLTIGAVLCTVAGVVVMTVLLALTRSMLLWWGALIGTFVMLFACQAVAKRFPINLAALALFAGLEGMTLTPILIRYASLEGPMILGQAALLSVAIFAMVGTLGYTSARSYAHWTPWLVGGLFVLIIGGIVLWFVNSSTGHWLWSAGGAILFTAFIFVDFTRIRHNYGSDDYVPATISVYLDLINLFLFILRLLGGRRN